jgi:phage portal protein BeeE
MARSGDVDNKITEVLQLFFQRGMMMTSLLKFDIPLDDDTVDSIKERWRKMYGGYENWTDVGVLDRNGSYQRMTPTFKEMGFDEIDSRNETRMLGPLGVPPILIGTRTGLKHATYANYEMALIAFWENTLIPQMGWFGANFEYHLTDERSFVHFDLSRVPALQRRRAEMIDAAQKMWSMGVPANIAFQQVGLEVPSVDGGDVGFLPSNVKPVDAIVNPPAPPPVVAPLPAAVDEDEPPQLEPPDDEAEKFFTLPLKKKHVG